MVIDIATRCPNDTDAMNSITTANSSHRKERIECSVCMSITSLDSLCSLDNTTHCVLHGEMSQYLRSGAPWLPCGVAKYPFKISHLKVNAGRCIAVLQDTTEQFFRQIAPFCHTHVCGECCTKELQKGRQLAHLSGPNNDWGATMFPSMDKRSPSCRAARHF